MLQSGAKDAPPEPDDVGLLATGDEAAARSDGEEDYAAASAE